MPPPIVNACGPPPPGEKGLEDGRLHSFRHYFCSEAANSREVSEQMLMSWLGHRDSKMVHRYFHAKPDEALRQMAAVDFTGPEVNGQAAG